MKINDDKGYSKIFLFFVFTLFLSSACFAQSRTFVTQGVFNTRKLDITSERISLGGNWNFFPDKLLLPTDIKNHRSIPVMVPSLWNEHSGLKNIGFGTYSLRLILPRSSEKWALEIPQLYNSYALYINDTLRASNGKPAVDPHSTELQWRPQLVTFSAPRDTVDIVLQLSNFHHYKGGIREPIYAGTESNIRRHFSLSMISVWVEAVVVLTLSIFFIFVFLKRRRARIALYFSLLCLSWAVRELFSDIYPVSQLFPDMNWFFLVRTEYIMLFMITLFGVLFINQLFRELASEVFKYLVVLINAIYIVFTLFTPVVVFTRWLPLYMITAIAVVVYAGFITVRGMMLEKRGAWFLIAGLIVAVVAIGYDLIAYKAALSNHVMVGSICYIIIFLACAVGVLQHLGIVRSKEDPGNTLRYQDLYK